MARSKRKTPRESAKIRIGDARVNRSDLAGLREAWRQRRLVLCLGAGVSIPYGMPSWNNLVLDLLFEQAANTRRLGRMYAHYRRALAAWMTDYFDYDPLVLARMVERDLDARTRGRASRTDGETGFIASLREHLYANHHEPNDRTVLTAIADLIARAKANEGVAAVISFNFDDLLELKLRSRKVDVQPVVDARRQRPNGLRVIHVHGYVTRKSGVSRRDLVFTEPDYHRLTETVFHWSLAEVVDHLRKNTVLFVGLSMSDPSLRRLLDASRNCDIPQHWQIQKRHEVRDHEVLEVLADVDRRARHYATLLGKPMDEKKKPGQLEQSVHDALRQADTYDREVFESMGVKTIWVEEFDHIPEIIDAISQPPRPVRGRT